MFNTREIPVAQWEYTLDSLGNLMAQESTRLWVGAKEQGYDDLAGPLPLIGMSVVKKGSDAPAIEVTLGERDDLTTHFTHMIRHPIRVFLDELDDGTPKCLWVDSQDATNTLVCFDVSLEPAPGLRQLRVATMD